MICIFHDSFIQTTKKGTSMRASKARRSQPVTKDKFQHPIQVVSTTTHNDIPTIGGKRLTQSMLASIKPKTAAQSHMFNSYEDGKNLLCLGSAGTGKSFLALYLALRDVMSRNTDQSKVVVVRSAVPTRDIGFLKGTQKEKEEAYELPYKAILSELFDTYSSDILEKAKNQGIYEFMTTSYIRGVTIKDAIVIVDECSNMTFHELDSVITRLGENCRVIFCGDYIQSDLSKTSDKDGLKKFAKILDSMYDFSHIEFGVDDIVRSSLVKSYLMTKDNLKICE